MRKYIPFLLISILSCDSTQENKSSDISTNDIVVSGAMKNVMWKGELGAVLNLDSLSSKGMFGIGPESYLTGELLLLDGEPYVSRVVSEIEMSVEKEQGLEAPFFVYAQVAEWKEIRLPLIVKNIKDIEQYLLMNYADLDKPFAFRLKGFIDRAIIHIQNLPEGSVVKSPKEAHQGQIDYLMKDQEVEIIGFFSTKHKGIFTHHDSFVHMHLITEDRSKMGHLDNVEIKKGEMILYLSLN